jgi:hypothetical protein
MPFPLPTVRHGFLGRVHEYPVAAITITGFGDEELTVLGDLRLQNFAYNQ